MNLLLTMLGLAGVSRESNTPAQQSMASALLGVALFRTLQEAFPQTQGAKE